MWDKSFAALDNENHFLLSYYPYVKLFFLEKTENPSDCTDLIVLQKKSC